ncbi:hypothetical protein GGF32_006900 [Allomyces javanicus]|nr:hypothetical protein GGF32_006900 [Allomyces javanicus]
MANGPNAGLSGSVSGGPFGNYDSSPPWVAPTLTAIVIIATALPVLVAIAGIFALHRTRDRAIQLEAEFALERGPTHRKAEEREVAGYWYGRLAAKCYAPPVAPPPPPPDSPTNKRGLPPSAAAVTPTPVVPVQGILATGDVDSHGFTVVVTARCTPYAQTDQAFIRVAQLAFPAPGRNPPVTLVAKFPSTAASPAATATIDAALDQVNMACCATRPARWLLRTIVVVAAVLWVGGIAVVLDTVFSKRPYGMWIAGPMNWVAGKQRMVGFAGLLLGWMVFVSGVWYESRLPLAARLAVAQLNQTRPEFRWHLCRPPVAVGKGTYILSPRYLATYVVAWLACCVVCLCSARSVGVDDVPGVPRQWAAPVETEWSGDGGGGD